ncbi:MAG TPA: methyltransferase domain-containing protein [Chthoniobacterales bacterium]|nr:methyltransferase domain-containing protein [Chthoniobacterales bacterium]
MNSAPDPGRSPKLEGIDFKRAAITYPSRLSAERLQYLRTKPFYNLAYKLPKFRRPGMDVETHRHFCDFANMALVLDLPPGARVLDVACGSGWLSEYFARLGYDVTGIDISPQLIQICEDRIRALPPLVDHETPIRCRFAVHDIELAALPEKFDAIICYDAMHHLEDAASALRHIAGMVPLGGLLFVLEGNRPAPGSSGEKELADVMREFGTLESPFDPAYLHQLLDQSGFAVVGDYVSVNGLFDRESVDEESRIRIHLPPVNYLLCKKVSDTGPASAVPDSRVPGQLRAELVVQSSWPRKFAKGEVFVLELKVTNTGDTLWLGGTYLRRGGITVGVKIVSESEEVVDEFHGQPALPRGLAPNESCTVIIERAAPAQAGSYTLKIDLVDQHICWFEERGSKPLLLPLLVG